MAAVSVMLAACTAADAETDPVSSDPGVSKAVIAVLPDGARNWHPDGPVIVSVTGGEVIPGELSSRILVPRG